MSPFINQKKSWEDEEYKLPDDIKANIKNLLTKAQQKKTVKPLIKILIKIQNNLFEKINRDTKKLLNKYKINI